MKYYLSIIAYSLAILSIAAALFGLFLFLLGIYDVSIGGNSGAAKFAGLVVEAIRQFLS